MPNETNDAFRLLGILAEAVAPRLRTTANGSRYCPACQREWAHDAPVEQHRDDCALVAAREAIK